jgi:hypothetical protein
MVAKGSGIAVFEKPLGTPPLLHVGDGLVVSRIGFVCVAIWRKDSTVERVKKQSEGLAKVVAQAPGKVGFLCVVEENSAPPNEEARRASARMLEEHGDRLRAVAVVIEGSGFRASIVRSVASGIVWLARRQSKTPVSYVATVDAGAKCLAKHIALGAHGVFIKDVELTRAVLDSPEAAG